MNSISDRLKHIRKVLGLSQLEFANKTKTSRSYISRCENGSMEINDRFISLVSSSLNVNEIWLRTGEGQPFFNANIALQRAFASYFIDITKAFAPVYGAAYGPIMPLFENAEVVKMYNYIALRVKKGGMTKKNLSSIAQSFDIAFPGYKEVIDALELAASEAKAKLESSKIARSVMPVSGAAAAGPPVYDDTLSEDVVAVPVKYASDRFFVVRVKGDSMEPRISDGDHVIVQRSVPPEQGGLVFCRLVSLDGEEYAIKQYHHEKGELILRSLNPEYPPINAKPEDIIALEKVVFIIR